MDLYCHPSSSFLGSPETNRTEYEYSSNVRFAGNLKGKLLLIHGTADLAVPLSHTIKLADALTRENKPFDMLVIPGWGHWGNERIERYWTDLISDYFVEHLMPKTDVEQRTQVRRQHPK